jgi:hypothetical protein
MLGVVEVFNFVGDISAAFSSSTIEKAYPC